MNKIIIEENIPLRDFTTFHIGGSARYFAVVNNISELKEAIHFSKNNKIPFWILGGGSNVLISDQGYPGLVIKNEIKKKEIIDDLVTVAFGSGENWDEAVEFTVAHNLTGLENLSGIPGTVGASPVQNIGAYGSEIKDTLSQVKVLNTETNEEEIFTNEQCQFAYRHSIFKKIEYKKYIITEVSFKLNKYTEGNKDKLNISYKDLNNYFLEHKDIPVSLRNVREAVLEIRKGKFPNTLEFGLAGSFYKNPIITEEKYRELTLTYQNLPNYAAGDGLVKIPLAWILDHVCQLRGYRVGNVGLHKDQPIVLVNYGGATKEEIINFSNQIKKNVKEKIGIEIEEEVEMIK